MSIDLHIHSLFSDGTDSPTEIVRLARKRGLTAISITDHDTLSGTDECLAAARLADIEVIPGIELSVVHEKNHFHLLGYFIDHHDRTLQDRIEVLQRARNVRNEQIIGKLNALGIDIRMDEINSVSRIGQTGRPHIAEVLYRKGVVANLNEAFDKYLSKDGSAYASRFVYNAAEAIDMISAGGGVAILAHPVQITPTFPQLARLVDELGDLGLHGIEVYYPTHSSKTRRKLREIARRHDMVMTGGSDYHGRIRPGTALAGGANVYVPTAVLEEMRERRRRKSHTPGATEQS